MGLSLSRPCRCGHGKDAHEHYRRGTDCSSCACEQFHGQVELTLRIGAPRRYAAAIVPEQMPAPDGERQVRPTHAAGQVSDPYPVVRPRSSIESSEEAVNGA